MPVAVLPLTIQSARLAVKIRAPSREVAISGFVDGTATPLRRLTSPFGIEQIDISDPLMLQLDKQGALFVSIEVSDKRSEATRDSWYLDWVGLEIRGETADQR